ncbi:MAG: FAD-binding protein [Coriobacteriales bacterium]|jgi:electron transfer flavoprotein alpha subunit|nr:FAD-binding protein [Coriobacteriales bacterium]
MKVFILAEDFTAATGLVAGARSLIAATGAEAAAESQIATSEPEVALVAFDQRLAEVSADVIYQLSLPPDLMLEDVAPTLAALITAQQPALLFVQPTRQLRLLAGKLAALLGTTAINDILACSADGNMQHLVYGGAAVRTQRAVSTTQIVFVPAGVLPDAAGAVPGAGDATGAPGVLTATATAAPTIVSVEFIAPSQPGPKLLDRKRREKTSVDLAAAKRVIGVGRGIAAEEDLQMIADLAAQTRAEVGCTRPIAEEEKWLPREVYIGVSGVILAPEIYIAIGLSGQVQHTVGINRAKTIFAINKDKNAPIFKQADFGIVADLYKVVPALTKALQ